MSMASRFRRRSFRIACAWCAPSSIQQANFSQQIGNTQSVDQIQSQLADPINLGSLVLDGMVDELLLKQAAKDFNVAVSAEEVETSIEKEFGFDRNPPTPSPTSTPQPTPTASAAVTQTATPPPTPRPTSTPISKESAQQSYQDYLKAYGLSDQDYRKYTELRLLSDKVREAIGATAPDDGRADQVPVYAHRQRGRADRDGGHCARWFCSDVSGRTVRHTAIQQQCAGLGSDRLAAA